MHQPKNISVRALILVIVCMGICTASSAQMNSSLTISSEDGKKFYLFLDGHLSNSAPQNNIKVQHLTERFYNCKIIFEDKMLYDITQKYLPMADANNLTGSIDAIYVISNKRDKQILKLISAKPMSITATIAVPPGVVVYDYGISVPAGPPRTGINPTPAHAPAMQDDIAAGRPMTKEDTITIQAAIPPSTVTHYRPMVIDTSHQSDTPCTHPMANSDFQAAKAAMNTTSYDETKLKGAKAIASGNCLLARQVVDLCFLFDFEATKLTFARFAYSHCYDKDNYFKVVNILRSDPDKAVLNVFIMKSYPIPVNIMDH